MSADDIFTRKAVGTHTLLLEAIGAFQRLPEGVKFSVLLVGKSMVASFVLALFVPLATAVYAMRYGFRVPVEGVPFLTMTITTWSFIGFALTASILTGTYSILAQFDLIDKMFVIYNDLVDLISLERKMISRKIRNILLIIPSIILIAVFFIFPLIFMLKLITASAPTPIATILSIAASLYFLFLLVSSMAAATGQTNINMQILVSPLVIAFMVISLFIPDTYGSFLRIIRYGGGIEAIIYTNENSNETLTTGYILIQNDRMVVLMLPDGNTIQEIPVDRISKKSFVVSPSWRMPNTGLSSQKKYLDIQL